MKAAQISRHSEIGVAPDDEEVFIEAAHLHRQTFRELIVAVRIREPKRKTSGMNAAPIAADAPIRVEPIEFFNHRIKLFSAVPKEQHVLMANYGIDSPRNGKELVDAGVGFVMIFLRVVDVQVLTIFVREPVSDERFNHLVILRMSSNKCTYRVPYFAKIAFGYVFRLAHSAPLADSFVA